MVQLAWLRFRICCALLGCFGVVCIFPMYQVLVCLHCDLRGKVHSGCLRCLSVSNTKELISYSEAPCRRNAFRFFNWIPIAASRQPDLPHVRWSYGPTLLFVSLPSTSGSSLVWYVRFSSLLCRFFKVVLCVRVLHRTLPLYGCAFGHIFRPSMCSRLAGSLTISGFHTSLNLSFHMAFACFPR